MAEGPCPGAEGQDSVKYTGQSSLGLPGGLPVFSSLVEQAALGVVYQDASGAITYANAAAQHILGLSLDEMQGRKSIDPRWRAIHPDGADFPGDTHPAMLALRTGKPVPNTVMGVYHPQTERTVWILIQAVPEFQPGQTTPFQVYTTFTDITELRQQELLREAAHALATAAWSLGSLPGLYQEIHRQASRLLDARSFYIALHDAEANLLSIVYQADEQNQPQQEPFTPSAGLELVLRTGIPQRSLAEGPEQVEPGFPGRCDPALAWMAAPLTVQGKVTGLLGVQSYASAMPFNAGDLGLLGDLAGQAAAAIDHMQMSQALRQVEARNQALIEHAPGGITVTDAKGRITFASPSALRIFGYSLQELISASDDALTHPDDLPRVLQAIHAVFMDPARVEKVEYRFRKKDGSYRWLESILSNLFAVPGVNGLVINFRDVTENKQAQEELGQANSQLLRAQANLELAQATARMGSWEMDLETGAGSGSKALFALHHITPQESRLDYSELLEKVHPDDRESLTRVLMQVVETGVPASLVYRTHPGSGDERVFEANGFIRRNPENNHPILAGTVFDITERYHAQQQLKQSEQALRAILNATQESLFLIELDGTIRIANEYGSQRLGGSAADLVGKNLYALLPPDLMRKRLQYIQQVVETRQPVTFEDVRGSMALLNSLYPLYGPQGEVVRLAIYSRDITASKQAQEQLKKRESFLQSIVSSAPGYILGINLDGYFTFSSRRWEGEPDEVFHSLRFIDQVHPDHVALAAQLIARTIQSRQIQSAELRVLEFSGQFHWWQVIFSPVIEDGQVAWLTIYVYDIEDRKQAELRLAASEESYRRLSLELEQRVQERTAQVQDLYDQAPNGYYSTDRDGVFQMINQTGLDWLGYTREEVLGKLKSVDLVSPLDLMYQGAPISYDSLAERLIQQGFLKDVEANLVRRDGSLMPVLIDALAVYGPEGEYVTNRVTVFDNTERKKAQDALLESERSLRRSRDELRAANAALEKASRLKDEFLASMSHELRTPLTGILGLSEALQLDVYGGLNDRQTRALRNIENSGRHLLELINDILDLSKIEADKLDLQLEPCNVADICQASLQLTRGLAQKKRQEVSFSACPPSILVMADPRRLKQMLVNLLSNAVKFTPEGGCLGLEVEGSEANQVIQFIVWDRGIGIKPEDLGRLFQPFTQLDSSLSRQYSGTGLGLSLVARLAKLHGGSVKVESTLGEGSRFTISLPWLGQGDSPLSPQPGSALSLRRCLLVEENEVHHQQMAVSLNRLGLECFYNGQGGGTLEMAARLKPDVVLLDTKLPDMPGEQVLCQLKEDRRTRDIPVLVCSVVEEHKRFLELGAAGCLVKPCSVDVLQQELLRLPGAMSQPVTEGQAPSGKGTVLFADDDEMLLQIMADFLHTQGYQAVLAHSGEELLELAPVVQADIILTDIQMPGLDGLQAIRQLRESGSPALQRVPIVAVTALAMPGDEELCMQAGANRYISKPISFTQVARLVEELAASQPKGS
jgi:PAS domain S-box-containing protein